MGAPGLSTRLFSHGNVAPTFPPSNTEGAPGGPGQAAPARLPRPGCPGQAAPARLPRPGWTELTVGQDGRPTLTRACIGVPSVNLSRIEYGCVLKPDKAPCLFGRTIDVEMSAPLGDRLEATRWRTDPFLRALAQPAAIVDDQLRLVAGNAEFLRMVSPDPLTVMEALWAEPANVTQRDRLRTVLSTGGTVAVDLAWTPGLVHSGHRRVPMRGTRLVPPPAGPGGLLLTVEPADLTVSEPVGSTHDLRQPLQAMSLLGSLLASRVRDPDVLPLVDRLQDTIRSMSLMLNELLDMQRGEFGGAIAAGPVDFPVSELFAALTQDLANRSQGQRWRLVSCHEIVHTDRRLLSQMLRAVLHYLLEHSHGGGLLLGARRRSQHVRIELWHSGFELDDARARALAAWLAPSAGRDGQSDCAASPELRAVRRIADVLGHRIEAAFRPGHGAVFGLEVPLGQSRRPSIPGPDTHSDELRSNPERNLGDAAERARTTNGREDALQRAATLTARQRQILDRVLDGHPSRSIAAELGVSRRTVENHRAVIMKKMGAASIPALIRAGIAAS